MFDLLFYGMIVATVIVSYLVWVRPLLKKNPKLTALFAAEDNYRAAWCAKFAGIKQRLLHAFLMLATAVVYMHDKIAPQLTGVDVTPIMTKIEAYVPSWGWPLIMIGVISLLDYFRKIADRETDAKIAAITPPAPPTV